MYTIYVDGNILYAPNLAGEGYLVLSPKLTMEPGKAGSLTFIIPPNNPLYDSVQKLKSVVTVYQDGEELFRGRVLHDEKDFYNKKDIYCEGELAFLLDSYQRPYEFEGTVVDLFKQMITAHNEQVDEFKQFDVGSVSISGSSESITCYNTNYSNTWDEINNTLIDTYGGYLRPRLSDGKRYIDWVEDYGYTNSQVIEFGVNILDITEYITAEDVFTVLIPVGAETYDSEGNSTGKLTIKSVNNDKDYIQDETAVSLFGKIWKVVEFSDVEDASDLLSLGKTYLQYGIEMAVSLTMNAVDLHLIDVNTERIGLGDSVRVISLPHGLDRYFTCSKMELNLVEPDKSTYTFGSTFTALTEQNVKDTKASYKIASEAKSAITQAQKSIDQVNKNMSQEGIFNLLTNKGQVQGILLDSDTGDIYINASYIKSGTLTLGGVNNTNGVLQILDADGNIVAEGNKDGLNLKGVVNATSGSLSSVTIVDGITISANGNEDLKDIPLATIEQIETGTGSAYRITFGELTGRSTPIAIHGSSVRIQGSSGITFSADNIIFENAIDVPDIYITKDWTALTLKNDFENKGFEAEQLEYKKIGNHVYIRGSVNFPSDTAWGGSLISVADLPTAIKPTRGNHYSLNACSGARVARVIATSTSGLSIEWIKKFSDGSNDTTTTGMWVSMNIDYWVD